MIPDNTISRICTPQQLEANSKHNEENSQLCCLPTELIAHLFSFLMKYEDKLHLGMSCRRMQAIFLADDLPHWNTSPDFGFGFNCDLQERLQKILWAALIHYYRRVEQTRKEFSSWDLSDLSSPALLAIEFCPAEIHDCPPELRDMKGQHIGLRRFYKELNTLHIPNPPVFNDIVPIAITALKISALTPVFTPVFFKNLGKKLGEDFGENRTVRAFLVGEVVAYLARGFANQSLETITEEALDVFHDTVLQNLKQAIGNEMMELKVPGDPERLEDIAANEFVSWIDAFTKKEPSDFQAFLHKAILQEKGVFPAK